MTKVVFTIFSLWHLDNVMYIGVFWGVYDPESAHQPTDGLRKSSDNKFFVCFFVLILV